MAVIFSDTFAGSGANDGTSPDTGFAGLTWEDTLDPCTRLTGYLTSTDQSGVDSVGSTTYGDGVSNYGLPDVVTINFQFRTGPSVASGDHTGFSIGITAGGLYFYASGYRDGASAWVLDLNGSTATFAGIASNSDFDGTLVIEDGAQTFTMNGVELTDTAAFIASDGLNQIDITIGGTCGIAYIEVVDPNAATDTIGVDAEIPAPTLLYQSGASVSALIPAPVLRMTVVAGVLNTIDAQVAAPTLEMHFASRIDALVPAPTLTAQVTTTTMIRIDGSVPAPTLSAAITAPARMAISLSVPAPELFAAGGAVVMGVIPAPTASIAITTGGTIGLDRNIAAPTIECRISSGNTISFDCEIPLPVAGPSASIAGVIPAPQIAFSMVTEVTITYEAYAVNLKPGENMPHQMTRYTNWPFNQFIRHGNTWYGVADDGLYPIGGTTDYAATPAKIAWQWHTAATDFGSRQKKQVRETFLHGRLSGTVVARVSVGEGALQSYAAQIERDDKGQAHRIKYGKGLKGEYWSFGMSGNGIGDIDSMQHEPAELGRKL